MSAGDVAAERARDLEARRFAQQEFRAPLVLEAGAGTGKTTALVARVAAWALGPGWERAAGRRPDAAEDAVAASALERVVAITFTEAAAAQMGTRVGEVLAGVARGETAQGLDEDLLPPAAERRTRAAALLGALDHLVVRTIHAFCRRLLAAYPLEAGLHPAFEVDADGTLAAEAIREVIEASLRLAYARGDADYLALAREGFGPVEIEQALQALVAAGVPAAALERDPYTPDEIEALGDELRTALQAALDLEGGRLAGVGGSTTRGTEQALRATARLLAHSPRTCGEFGDLVRALGQAWNAKWLRRLEDWHGRKFGKGERDALGPAAEDFAKNVGPLAAALAHVVQLSPEGTGRARRVLQPLLAAVHAELRLRGIVSFQQLLVGARDLLARRDDVTAEVRRGIDQLLVDEFQDTDRTQCELVARIALAGPDAERPGLFVVGDPKQSIYGWRSADLEAYYDFVSQVLAAGGARRTLSVNFRSVPAVLEEVGRAIRPVMVEEPGVQPAFEELLPCPAREGQAGFAHGRAAPVEYWISWQSERAERGEKTRAAEAAALEAGAVARQIRQLHDEAGVEWKEFGLLFRSRGDLDVYLAALRDAGVPYAVQGDRSYYRRREVIEASALLRCVLDPNDALSLLTTLRSAFVGVPDAALIPLWVREFPALATRLGASDARAEELEAIETQIRAAAAAVPGDVPGLEHVAGWERSLLFFVRALARLRVAFRTEPADRFVEALRRTLLLEVGEAARYQGIYRLANLDALFRGLVHDLDGSEAGSQAVLRDLRRRVADAWTEQEGRPLGASEDTVQIYTIHQAKGLDFGHVYLLQLHKQSGGDGSSREPQLRAAGDRWEYRLFGVPTPRLREAAARRKQHERAELVRTLYVAMTRASERLVLCGNFELGSGADEGSAPAARPAATHAQLLEPRLAERARVARGRERDGTPAAGLDVEGARLRLPAFEPAADAPGGAAIPDGKLPSPERVRAESAQIRRSSEAAGARMQRRLGGAASAEAHRRLREDRAEARGAEAEARPREQALAERIATAVGSAVHAALERLDLAAAPATLLAEAKAHAQRVLGELLDGAGLAQGRERADALLEQFAAGPLLPRLRALHAHVVARELDLVASPGPGEGAPLGFESGAIDLLYRDPDGGQLVIADYKTDRVQREAELAQRIRAYRSQGEVYARGVRQALRLDYTPRFELWFLSAGRVEVPGPEE